MSAHSDYLENALSSEPRQKIVDFCVNQVSKIDCDSIAFRGMSGALIAPIVSYITGKNLIMVRKSDDSSHSDFKIETSSTKCKKFVIIDDFISRGKTIDNILETIMAYPVFDCCKCVGIILYNDAKEYTESYKKSIWIKDKKIEIFNYHIMFEWKVTAQ